jgi:hypothetical protein
VSLQREYDRNFARIEVVPQGMTRVLPNLFGNGFYATSIMGRLTRSNKTTAKSCRELRLLDPYIFRLGISLIRANVPRLADTLQ